MSSSSARLARLLPSLLVLLAGTALPQEYRGRVQGVVLDPSGSAVAGARVTLLNDATGVSSARDTDVTGRYLFDMVEPGAYTVSVDAPGFSRSVQKNVAVQNRSDITADVQLQVGAITETVTITGAPVTVQFNTTSMEVTLDRAMVENLPLVERNPWTLSMLHPAVLNNFWTKPKNSYRMWSSSSVEIGGSHTYRNNDLLIDGMPAQYGTKGSYSPPVDAVTEVTVQQNSVDAEFGHFAGGLLNVSTKGGTNELHGRAYYFGRNPSLNAAANSMTGAPNENENHSYGGSAGFPILRNRLFNHSSIEMWDQRFPKHLSMTMPTEPERTGDFSKSLNARGGLRTIFDPWTTKLNTAANTSTRTAFPGNIIPKSRLDATALEWMKDVWGPNNPGVGPTGVGNFDTEVIEAATYRNFTSRTDWVVNDRLKVFGRFSIFRTDMADDPYTPNNSRAATLYGAPMNALNLAGDAVYTLDSATVLNLRGAYGSFQDDFVHEGQLVTKADLERFWPGNPFYAPYLDRQDERVPLIYPFFQVGASQFSRANMWLQRPRHRSAAAKISRQQGAHYIKFGGEWRYMVKEGWMGAGQIWNFRFNATETASTTIRPDTTQNGHEWASFLLGSMMNNSLLRAVPYHKPNSQYWSAFLQDDWKLSRNITVNAGLRWEYEQGVREANMMLSRGFDLDSPIPEFEKNPPVMPAQVRALMNQNYRWTGAWNFTDDNNPSMFDPPKLILLPRIGLAMRINDRSSLRIGYGRTVAQSSNQADIIEQIDIPGYAASTNIFPMLEGVPQAVLHDPFNNNPLVLPDGKKYGRYTGMGGAANWHPNEFRPNVNDRINVALQRALPLQFVAEGTWFMNFARNVPYVRQFYPADPGLSYTYKTQLATRVNNPFYNALTADTFPGSLRNQRQVTVGSLLKPMPHYTNLTQENTPGRRLRYSSFQLRLQRPFANGFNFLLGYNYNRERREEFFNSDMEYLNQFIWARSPSSRHKLNVVSVWNLPFGKGRRFMNRASRAVEGMLGGWTATGTYTYVAGAPLRFGQMEVIGDPTAVDRSKWGYIFNPKAFKLAEPYTPRTNPLWFGGVLGPGQKQLDATLAKDFSVTERFRLEFRLEAENLSNTFTAADPNLGINSSTFGLVTAPRQGRFGRVLQYNLILHF